jgi:DNA helicase IV
MTATVDDIREEQTFFDVAWDHRERSRQRLLEAPAQSAGPRAGAASMRRQVEAILEELPGPEEAVAFGRFDTADGTATYVGKRMIHDDDHELLVINWKLAAAAPFYESTPADPGDVARIRKYSCLRNTITDIEESILADLARRVEELTDQQTTGIDDVLLRDLETGRTGEMRDIVQTIHATQYGLVRAPMDQVLIIQGGPGTGKTAVALHRASWLLYNHREDLAASDVLVVGPNATFTKYIRQVLPGLGDVDVAHIDLRRLGPQASTGRSEPAETATLKGEERMADLLQSALTQRVRFPERVDRIPIGPEAEGLWLTRDEVEDQLPAFSAWETYNGGRSAFRAWVTRVAAGRRNDVPASAIDAAVERVWPNLTAASFLRDLLGSRDRLLAAAGDTFLAGDVSRLQRTPAERISDEQWSDADVALLDEADSLINGVARTYKHVVVDEAQDLSPMQLRSLRRRCPVGSYTIVGDLAQSTSLWARSDWESLGTALATEHPVAVEELELGYRVPEQIFEFAAQLLPYAAPGIAKPTVIRRGPSDPDLVEVDTGLMAENAISAAVRYAGHGHFVGIICPDAQREHVIAELRANDIQWSDTDSGGLGTSINLASPEQAKGLEFDAVVVVDPTSIVDESPHGHRMLYVALTRTTKHLTVVHDGVALPGPDSVRAPSATGTVVRGDLPADKAPPESSRSEARTSGLSLADTVARAVASEVAAHLRQSTAPETWPQIIDLIRRDLGVSDEEMFEQLG